MSLAARHLQLAPPVAARLMVPRQDPANDTVTSASGLASAESTGPSSSAEPDRVTICGFTYLRDSVTPDPQGRQPICDGLTPGGPAVPGPGMKYCGAGPGVTNNLIQQSVYEPCPYSNQQSTPEIVAANPSGGSSPSQVSGSPVQSPSQGQQQNPETQQSAGSSSNTAEGSKPEANPSSPARSAQPSTAPIQQAGGTSLLTSAPVGQTSPGIKAASAGASTTTARGIAGVQSSGSARDSIRLSLPGCKARMLSVGAIMISLGLGFVAVI